MLRHVAVSNQLAGRREFSAAHVAKALLIDQVKGLIGEGGRETGAKDRIKAEKDAWWESWMPYLTNDSKPISPYRVIWELNQNLDKENSIVTHDAGAPRDQMAPFYTATTRKVCEAFKNVGQIERLYDDHCGKLYQF